MDWLRSQPVLMQAFLAGIEFARTQEAYEYRPEDQS